MLNWVQLGRSSFVTIPAISWARNVIQHHHHNRGNGSLSMIHIPGWVQTQAVSCCSQNVSTVSTHRRAHLARKRSRWLVTISRSFGCSCAPAAWMLTAPSLLPFAAGLLSALLSELAGSTAAPTELQSRQQQVSAHCYAVLCCSVAWYGVAWYGVAWCGVLCCGVTWCAMLWCGMVECGVARCSVVWHGVVWCGMVVWHGVVWCGMV